ncbi:MAG: polynucleotide adenylyltransferase PcnB [Treponema sp.]|nr:polynucleotide adenylyltransferase PcnB [Treponema sp.]
MLIRYSTDQKGRPHQKAVIYTKDEHTIPRDKIDPDAYFVVSKLRGEGFDAYIVGGAVRDLIVGRTPKDFDIVTSATPSKIKKLFRNSRIIGRRFRLVHVFFGEKIFEVSTFRSISEGSVGNVFGTMDEDVQRRDFSLNALYYDPIKEQVIDYVHGVEDIRHRIIRPVIPLDRIFIEDPVRMLRAVKYSATTGCKLPFSVRRKIRKSAHLLSPVSPSRLTEEMLKILNSGHAYDIIQEALSTDLYMYLQPSACAMLYADRRFESRYMEHLKELDAYVSSHHNARLGEKLSFLIYDFITNLTDWKQEVATKSAAGELYTRTWRECRNFVLPMNPQRTELEFAIRTSLKKLGVGVRIPKNAFSGREKTTQAPGQKH